MCELWKALLQLRCPDLEGIKVTVWSEFEGNGVASETWELVWEVVDTKTGFKITSTRLPGHERSLIKAIEDVVAARRLAIEVEKNDGMP